MLERRGRPPALGASTHTSSPPPSPRPGWPSPAPRATSCV
jgi:hypothetical protein